MFHQVALLLSLSTLSLGEEQMASLIVTTGEPLPLSVATEAFNVDNETKCSLPDYPERVSSAFGDVINSTIIVCGGATEDPKHFTASPSCYTLYEGARFWVNVGRLLTPRREAGAIAIDGKLFVTGGRNRKFEFLDTTEFFDLESAKSSYGPSLPLNVSMHCVVQVSSTHLLIIGGWDGESYLKDTFYYSIPEETFENGPDLLEKRSVHSCQVLQTGSARYVVVAGGCDHQECEGLESTEYLEISDSKEAEWKSGPSLPLGISYASMVAYDESIVLVGGISKNESGVETQSSSMYSLTCLTGGCEWTEMDTQLTEPRSDHLAFAAPDSFANCE